MLKIFDKTVKSRLFLGTAGYPSPQILCDAITIAETEIITVSLRRQMLGNSKNTFWKMLQSKPVHILPNTAGCYTSQDAIVTAEMARELFETHWIKLELIGDDYTLQPNPFELLKAAEILVKKKFEVFPYCTDDLVLCQRLIDCGCKILMPWAAPIGSAKGIINPYALQLLRERFPKIVLVIDAGIGRPSDATYAMELGYDAVLINSAVALSNNPIQMADAFAKAVLSGHLAYHSGIIPSQNMAIATTPLIGKPFWNEEKKYEPTQ